MNSFKDYNKPEFYIFLFFSVLISYFVQKFFIPHEDASILFRYSENFADTGIISYNINGSKTEGATDFLWMVLLSIFYFFGINTFFASIFVNLLSLYFIAKLIKNYYSLTKFEFYILIFFHLSLTQTYASIGGFSVLFVELILVLLIINFLKENVFQTLLFSFIGCLVRPDFILFIIIPNIINLLNNFNLKTIKLFSLFIFLGIFYFYLRYTYFDFFLPLPFYIKNQWNILNNLEWGRQVIILSPALFILFFTNFKNLFKKSILSILAILFLTTSYYTNQILYQNVGYRFYFYFAILTIFLIYEIQSGIIKQKFLGRNLLIFIAIFSTIINYSQKYNSLSLFSKNDEIYLLSKELKKINEKKKISLATTEAGLIPYYSKINTIDLFGLNTKDFAKSPADGSFLLKNNFDIIVINTSQTGNNCNSLNRILVEAKNLENKISNRDDNWDIFTLKLLSGIEIAKYDAYFFSYPTNIFVNKNSKAYYEISKIISDKKILECKFN